MKASLWSNHRCKWSFMVRLSILVLREKHSGLFPVFTMFLPCFRVQFINMNQMTCCSGPSECLFILKVCVFGVKKVVIIRPLILSFSHPTHFSKARMDRLIFNMDYIDLSLITFWKVYTIWLMNLHPLDWISCIFSNMLLSFLYECVGSICCVASAHFSCLKASPDIHTVYTFREKSFFF